MERKGVFNDGEAMVRDVVDRMNKLTCKNDHVNAAKPHMAKRVLNNPNFEFIQSVQAIYDNTSGSRSNLTTSVGAHAGAKVPNSSVRVSQYPSVESVKSYAMEADQTIMGTKVSETHVDLVSNYIRVLCVPGMANVVDLSGVPLNTLGDIDNLTKDIELDKYEVWSDLPSEKHTEVIDTIWAMRDAFVAENPNMTSGYSSNSGKSDPLDSRVKGSATGGSKPVPSKSKANFHSLFLENLCEGANFSIPRKFVETVFSEDGLSIIASQIGKPIMLDSYTSSMCIESWGRSSFARCLIEINVDDVLKESLTIGVPLIEGSGFTIETVTIEYEWKPPHYDLCKIFGHVHDHCPKKVSIPPTVVTSNVATPTVKKTNNGIQTVGKNKKKGKSKSTNSGHFGGHSVKQTVRYEPKATTSTPKKGVNNVGNASKSSSVLKTFVTSTKKGNITTSNSYFALDDDSDEEVENVYDESANLFQSTKIGGSSSTFTTTTG
ncbi:zinc knuckle CX2CX4HX4C containing protein [Tanacetum coccineum]